jgi:D-3-phosphoglycerate dehydrogenase
VVATPHVGGLVPEAIAHQALETTRQVAEILAGRAPLGAVNPEHAQRLGLRPQVAPASDAGVGVR